MESNNKRIVRNTMMLYIRMLLSVLVGLYTSRVVLQTLGVEDYGTYGVVGGVVALFSFINAAMSGATSRFLTYEIGKGDCRQLCETFSSALIIHIGIALFIFLLSETFGLWFLCNKLVIPEGRMLAAHIVYQCSILSMMIGVTQVPYNATIIAHEKMDVYAYVELMNVFLKLGIVYLLLLFNYDKLILYAVLVLAVSIIIAFTYRIYCLHNFNESHFHWVWRLSILRPMLSFTGWSAMSECGYSFRVYGSNIVLNMFFGTIVNAAGNIANTIQGILLGFIGNVTTAVRPQIIKSYSVDNITRMKNLIQGSIKLNLFLISLLVLPFISETHFILQLWLGSIPEYSVAFCRYLMLAIFITGVSQIITIGIQATGDIRATSIVRNILYIATPFIIYFFYRNGLSDPTLSYGIIVLIQMVVCLIDVFILVKKIPVISGIKICIDYFLSMFFVISLSFITSGYSQNFTEGFLRLFVSTIVQWFILCFFFYFIVFSSSDREMINDIAWQIICKFRNRGK